MLIYFSFLYNTIKQIVAQNLSKWKTKKTYNNPSFHMQSLFLRCTILLKRSGIGKMCLAFLLNGHGVNHQVLVLFHGKRFLFSFFKTLNWQELQKVILFG